MKRPDISPALRRRRFLAVGVVALAIIVGAAFSLMVLGRQAVPPVGDAPSPTPIPTTPTTPVPSATPPPTPSSTAAPTQSPRSTPTPTPPPAPREGWLAIAIDGIHAVSGIVEGNDRLVATGQDAEGTGVIVTSDDGETWSPVQMAGHAPAHFYSVTPGEDGFVAVATRFPIPMSMPELDYLHSRDGRVWEVAEPPAECVSAGIVALDGGYLGLGDRCRTEGDFAPGTLHILHSPDGRTWTSRRDEAMRPGPWATDGRRVVLLQEGEDHPGGGWTRAWISDDAGQTWRPASSFPDGFHPSGLFHGHDVYLAPASSTSDDGDPQPAMCRSGDGDQWTCERTPPLEGALEGRNWLMGHMAVTPTGFASLADYVNDPFFGGDGSTDMVLATSADGAVWEFRPVPELKDRLPSGIAGTTHGLFSWGGLNRDITPDEWVPYLVVHAAPLP